MWFCWAVKLVSVEYSELLCCSTVRWSLFVAAQCFSHANMQSPLISLSFFSLFRTPPPTTTTTSVPEAKWIFSALPVWNGAQWEHGAQHPQQLQGHAFLHDQFSPEECWRSTVQSENWVRTIGEDWVGGFGGGRGELWGKKWRRCLLMQQTLEMMKAWGDGVRVSFFGQCGWAGSGAAYVLLPLPLLRIAPEPGVDVKANKESWLRTLTNLFFSSPNVSINLYGGSDSGQQQSSSDDSWSLELNDHRALKRPEASFDGDLLPSWWLSI